MKTNVLNMLNAGILFCLLGCLSGCDDYRRVNEPTQEITVNSKSLNLFVGETRQLTASPTGNAFDWSSDDPDVVTVNSDGLVTAVSEGFSTIVVASGNSAEVSIDVRVRVRIPLTDIHLPSSSLKLVVGSSVQLDVNAVPDDASDVTFTWRSENPDIAIVDNAGTVMPLSIGTTNVIVAAGAITKTIPVNVLYQYDKTGWSVVAVSDETASDGGGKDKIIDGSYLNTEYWHSKWDDGGSSLPHWVVVDMKTPIRIGKIITLRRSVGDTKTLQYFVGDDPNPSASSWVKIIEGAYPSVTAAHSLALDTSAPVATGQYLKLVLPDSFRGVHISICEIDVYEMIE